MTPTTDDLPELQWRDPPPPSASVSTAIKQACARDLDKGKGPSASRRAALSVLVSGAVVATMLAMGLAQKPLDATLKVALFAALGWGVVHSLVLTLGLARPPGRRGSWVVRWALALGLPVLFFAYLTLSAQTELPFARFVEADSHAPICGLFTLLFGAVAAGGTLFAWRRTDPLTPGLSGALAGLCGGLAAATGIGLGCASHEAWHLWLAHGTVLLVFVAVGWFVGRKWLAP